MTDLKVILFLQIQIYEQFFFRSTENSVITYPGFAYSRSDISWTGFRLAPRRTESHWTVHFRSPGLAEGVRGRLSCAASRWP